MDEYLKNKYFCYIFGLIWADGYIGDRIDITMLYDDLYPMLDIFDQVDVDWKFIERERIDNRSGKLMKKTLTIRTSDKKMKKFLLSMDFDKKSKSSPLKILNLIDTDNIKYFIRGLFDGDGCFYHKGNTKQCSIASNYEQNWDYMSNIFNALNCRNYISRQDGKYGKNSVIRITSKDFIKFGDYMYEDFFGMVRKYNKFNRMKKSYDEIPKRISEKRKKVKIQGCIYDSITIASKQLELDRSCIRYRLKSKNFGNYLYV
jgi:hypothetical protein